MRLHSELREKCGSERFTGILSRLINSALHNPRKISLFAEVTNLGASVSIQGCEERTQNRVLRRNTASRQHSILLLKGILTVFCKVV